MRGLAFWALAAAGVLATACTFGASGAGAGADTSEDTEGAATGTTGAGPGSSPTASGSAGDAGSTAPPDGSTSTSSPSDETTVAIADDTRGSSTSDAPPASTSDSSTSDSSTGGDDCAGPGEDILLFVEDAELGGPMQLTTSSLLPGMPSVAFSAVEDQGTVTFTLDVACEAEFRIWGLVWDETPGADNGADSYYVSIDGGPELDWYYGCQTGGASGAGWSYQPVMDWVMFDCVYEELSLSLAPGSHTVAFRNREGGFGENVASIAAIVASSDPATDPADLYDPAP